MIYSITSVNWEKYVFHREKCNFEPILNSARSAKFLVLRNALNIYYDYCIWCFTQADNRYNENNSNTKLYTTMSLWWTGRYVYVKFNVFSVIRDDFGHVLIPLCLRVSQWGQVVKMNFSSINFDSCWKLFGSFSTSLVKYNERVV